MHSKEEESKRIERLKAIVLSLPESPGSYQYYDETDTVIYVGKAKNLKRRVSSYFNKQQQSSKTRLLVSKIEDIRYIVVKTEEDALLLENNLIKKFNPKYNILLKDGKTYPSICITNEIFPRIIRTRNIDRKMGAFYGPYSHVPTMYALLDLIKNLYHPRTCNLNLSADTIKEGRYKVCLEYHIKNCKGICIGKQSREDYMKGIENCREILKGNTAEVADHLRVQMEEHAENLEFEEAAEIKKQIELIEGYRAKSEVVSRIIHNIDVFSIEIDDSLAYINFFHIAKGSINQAYSFEYKRRLDETRDEILLMAIVEMRQRFNSSAKEIVLEEDLEIPIEGIVVTIPQKGEKKKLLDLSRLNVKQYRFDRMKQAEKLNPEQKQVHLMKEIQKSLKLNTLPLQIECFDNSNISGTDAVAACVVFKNLKPSKKDYRKYIIKTVVGPDDYASMQEVVRRRYKRFIDENIPLPNLIITDGGKGQMEVVRKVVEDELGLKIPIAGLAKDDKHRTRELLFGFPPITIGVDIKSQLFKVLTQMQDEVHRFAITFHKDKRSKRQTHSELDEIKGIGDKTKQVLLKKFHSVKAIKSASEAEIQELLGEKRGSKLYQNIHSNTDAV